MLNHPIIMAIVTIFIVSLSGCALPQYKTNKTNEFHTEMILSKKLEQQKWQIMSAIKEESHRQQNDVQKLSHQLNFLAKRINHTHIDTDARIITVPVPKICPETLGDKFLLGQVEHVYVEEIKATFDTRIDTGAASSSIDARKIILFERDGEQWVKFDVFTHGENQPSTTFEAKVARFVRIKQDPSSKGDRRPVIRAHLQIGKYAAETDLNLTDRSHMDYPLLLGRKFMKDIAIVDVSQTYINGEPQIQPNQPIAK